jgi:hypothetical protein
MVSAKRHKPHDFAVRQLPASFVLSVVEVPRVRARGTELPGQIRREDGPKDMDARMMMDLLTEPLERSGHWT